jgi:phage terminase large subunit
MHTLNAVSRREDKLALAQAIAFKRMAVNKSNTVYGIYEPSPNGPKLLRCMQEQKGKYVEVDKQPTVTVPAKLERFVTSKRRFKVAFGGRSGAKSNTIGDILAADAKDYGDKTICLRELQNSIEDSVHALLAAEIKRLAFDDFEVTNNAIRLKGEDVFKFKGLARNPDSVKSMFGFKRAWCEEAQTLSQDSITMLTPTIREKDSEIWLSLNPGSSEDAVSKRFLAPFYDQLLAKGYYEDDLHLIVWINYTDNPWHSNELEQERLYDEVNLSKAAYDHKWLGHYNDEIEGALIEREWFDACIDAHKKLGFDGKGARYAAHDPSDTGPDSKGYAARHGSVVYSVEESVTGTINDGGDWATGLALQQDVDHYTWDCDGMGVGLSRQTSEAFTDKPIKAHMFKGSESPDNPMSIYQGGHSSGIQGQKTNGDVFRNKRAQNYQRLRDRCYKTYRAIAHNEYNNPEDMISFCSDIPLLNKLRAEVCKMPVKPNANGLIELYTKDVMKRKFNVPSPNLADSVMMLMCAPSVIKKKTKINYQGWG